MCSVVMDTDDAMADYGLWDRTLMEVDLLEENYRHEDVDYLGRGGFLESDPLLPLINTIVGGNGTEEDASQLFLALSRTDRSTGNRSSPSSSGSDAASDLDVDQGASLYSHHHNHNVHHDGNYHIPNIIIKTEPYDGTVRNLWVGVDGRLLESDAPHVVTSPNTKSGNKSHAFALPPTPPCSNDGESLPSPLLSTVSRSPNASLSLATAISPSLSTSEDGTLILTEEEKRTLIAEGYPIPARLPLTKAEERSLKRIRRKIKNKISAQESRRKKKEYIESLEKKVKNLNDDNNDLRRRLENSETNNRSLADQLCKFQTLVKTPTATKVQIAPATVRRAVPSNTDKYKNFRYI